MAKSNLTKAADINVTVREIDFVTRFGLSWEHLREILGIMRPIQKQPGTMLKSKVASVTLQSGSVGEGEEIPYSKAAVNEVDYATITIEKYAKAVSLEAIDKYGYEVAVSRTDRAFLNELQKNVTARFYSYLNGGYLTNIQKTFQSAMAMAKGLVENFFKSNNLDYTEVVGFANILDIYEYLGTANITIQNRFGFSYVRDFMGFRVVFLLGNSEIPRGRVIATPVENIVLYYVNPSDSAYARAGLSYVTDGETNLIGFHTAGNYNTAVSECFAIMGMTLFAEYVNGIAVVTLDTGTTLGTLTVTSVKGSANGKTVLSVSELVPASASLYYKIGDAAAEPAYLTQFDATGWTAWDGGDDDITATNNKVATVIEVNGSGQVVAGGHATVVSQ